jgi:Uma2 family endonuclease
MVAQRTWQHITVEEWRALSRASPDVKYEYVDGEVYAMSMPGGSRAHAWIAVNAVTILNSAFAGGPCMAYNSDVATRVSAIRYNLPDVVVSCDARDEPTRGESEILAPRVVFEVLSDSTEARDRGEKFDSYRACPTIQEYVVVRTDRQAVEVYRRAPDGWGTFQVYGSGDEVELTSVDARFPVAALYQRTDVPATPASQAPEC